VATLDKDQIALKNARGFLKDIKQKIKGLKENRDALDKKFATVTQEKNEMYMKFETVINDLRKKANYKNHILE